MEPSLRDRKYTKVFLATLAPIFVVLMYLILTDAPLYILRLLGVIGPLVWGMITVFYYLDRLLALIKKAKYYLLFLASMMPVFVPYTYLVLFTNTPVVQLVTFGIVGPAVWFVVLMMWYKVNKNGGKI